MGGLARRVAFIKKIKAEAPNVVLVDTGDSLAFWPELRPLQMGMAQRKAAALAKVYHYLGYEAVGIGRRDLGLGAKELKRLSREVPLISSNLKTRDFTPLKEKVVEVAGVRIGIFALTAPIQKTGFAMEDPLTAAEKSVSRLREQGADLVICLSNLGEEGDENLAEDIRGIDLILGSGPGPRLYKPEEIDGVFIFRPHPKGKSVGVITLTFNQGRLEAISHQLYLLEADKYPEDAETAIWLKEQGLLPQGY